MSDPCETRPAPPDAELELERARVREIDHRAKNSLQLAGSLALLSARRAPSAETQAALNALHRRIAAVAAVHHGFLESPAPGRFDLTAFLRDQVATLTRTAPPDTAVDLDLEPVEVPSASAAPLALIVNELVGNALAYSGPAPRVRISLAQRDGGCRLAVADSGPGLPANGAGEGFGLTIVRLMAQQLRAELAFEDAQPGLRALVTLA
jgi:two-component sensor histidine kinase